MHEMALCEAIYDKVVSHADGRAVRLVNLRIGHLRQVIPDTLAFCWDVSVDDTPLAGSTLEVVHVPATVRCRSCDHLTTLDNPIMLCDACDGADVEVIEGDEFEVTSIDVSAART